MDAGAVSGPSMAVLGISMVFLALLLLIVVIGIMDRILARLSSKKAGLATDAKAESSTVAAASAGEEEKKDEMAAVALAAWGLHQRRRVSVRPAANTSRWAALARAKQLAGTGNRGR
ncbi:MAG: OadG family protein [Proteobacteria bacterium]|nr:OadG family protein [Pseudomonadota bacterium]